MQTLTHAERLMFSKMAQFIGDSSSSSSSSDSSDSSASGSESDPESHSSGFNVVTPEPVKSNEARPDTQNSKTEKDSQVCERDPKEKQKNRQVNKKARKGNPAKNQDNQKEKVTPERTVHMVKKIIVKNKKRATKDKAKLNKLLKSASAAARKYKAITNKVAKKSS